MNRSLELFKHSYALCADTPPISPYTMDPLLLLPVESTGPVEQPHEDSSLHQPSLHSLHCPQRDQVPRYELVHIIMFFSKVFSSPANKGDFQVLDYLMCAPLPCYLLPNPFAKRRSSVYKNSIYFIPLSFIFDC